MRINNELIQFLRMDCESDLLHFLSICHFFKNAVFPTFCQFFLVLAYFFSVLALIFSSLLKTLRSTQGNSGAVILLKLEKIRVKTEKKLQKKLGKIGKICKKLCFHKNSKNQ